MALLLILCVAIPFLIIMIAIYIVYGFMSPASISCKNLCLTAAEGTENLLPNSTVRIGTIPTQASPTTPKIMNHIDDVFTGKGVHRRSVSAPEVPMAALLQNLYVDDDEEYIFGCPAAVLTNEWALTTSDCVQKDVSMIRLKSWFWSSDGIITPLRNTVISDNLVLLRFEPQHISGAKLGRIDDSKMIRSFFWDSRITVGLSMRKKYGEMASFSFGSYKMDNCTDVAEDHVSCLKIGVVGWCGRSLNAPMLNENNELVGFHLRSICQQDGDSSILYYVNVQDYKSWISSVVNH